MLKPIRPAARLQDDQTDGCDGHPGARQPAFGPFWLDCSGRAVQAQS